VELAQKIQVHSRFVVKSLCEGPADEDPGPECPC
jgi:hypothetical protein